MGKARHKRFLIAILLLAGSASAAAQGRTTLTGLGFLEPGAQFSRAFAINDAGQATGIAGLANGQGRAFLYSGGSMLDLGTFGGTASAGEAVNAAGMVAGWATLPAGNEHAFVY